MLNKAELSKQKGVYTAGPMLGRDQGCWSASGRLRPSASPYIPVHPRTSVPARSASAHAGPAHAARPQPFHRVGCRCHQKCPQGRWLCRQLILGDLLGSGGWFLSSSWGDHLGRAWGASALFDMRKTLGFPRRRLLNSLIWVLFCACCCHEIQTDSLQLPQLLHPFRWKEEEKEFSKEEQMIIQGTISVSSFWHRFFS